MLVLPQLVWLLTLPLKKGLFPKHLTAFNAVFSRLELHFFLNYRYLHHIPHQKLNDNLKRWRQGPQQTIPQLNYNVRLFTWIANYFCNLQIEIAHQTPRIDFMLTHATAHCFLFFAWLFESWLFAWLFESCLPRLERDKLKKSWQRPRLNLN